MATPNLSQFSQQSVLFENATTAIPLTNPSHTSLMTGLYPGNHGIRLNKADPLDPAIVLLPEMLVQQGYRSAAFVSAMPLSREQSKLGAKFQLFDDDIVGDLTVPDMIEKDGLFRFLFGEPPVRNYRNADAKPTPTIGRHEPISNRNYYSLSASEKLRLIGDPASLARLTDLYAGEVSYVDRQLGRFFDTISDLKLLDHTIIVFVADHGESLTEHDYYFDHSADLYQPSLHVPLIVRFPDGTGAGLRVRDPVCTTDVMPTILSYLKFDLPQQLDGRSLLGTLSNRKSSPDNRVIVSSLFEGEIQGAKRLLSLRWNRYKYIRTSPYWADLILIPAKRELYDLSADPEELNNLYDQQANIARRLGGIADKYWNAWNGLLKTGSQNNKISQLQTMKSLGYMH